MTRASVFRAAAGLQWGALRHSNARTTLANVHLRGGITEQAMSDVADSFRLHAVRRKAAKGNHYIQ